MDCRTDEGQGSSVAAMKVSSPRSPDPTGHDRARGYGVSMRSYTSFDKEAIAVASESTSDPRVITVIR